MKSSTASLLLAWAALASASAAAADSATSPATLGKQIALDRGKGNCLACHAMPSLSENDQPGNLGPPLVSIKARYPDRALLRQRLWDETKFNPNTSMPPFGKHRILSEQEIDHIVEFLYSL